MDMGNLTLVQKGCVLFKTIIVVPSLLLFLLSKHKRIILSDVKAWAKYRNYVDERHLYRSLFLLLVLQPEFQSQFKMRLGGLGHLSYGGIKSCDLAYCKNIGKGFVLMHGFGTVFNSFIKIGNNCTVLHNVTIGAGKNGVPTIGNNVYIGAGAIIIGGITVGNNVNIGAGAIVVEDVPSNTTIVSQKARIILHS